MSNHVATPGDISMRARRIIDALREVPESAEWGQSRALDEAICEYVGVLKKAKVPAAQAAVILERALDESGALHEVGLSSLGKEAVISHCLRKYYHDEPLP
jgi:hypothetical protein